MSRARPDVGPTAGTPGSARPRPVWSRPEQPQAGVPGPVHPAPEVSTPAGLLRLRPVDPAARDDVALVHRWMHADHVQAWWQTALPVDGIARYLRDQTASGHSRPFLGELADDREVRPLAYLELYRADLDPLAAHYPARPHDLGLHLLVGDVGQTGRGLGRAVIGGARDALLAGHPAATRVVAEPDVRNTASVRAFAAAGFRACGELSLPDKTAVLMVGDRPGPR